MVERRRVLVSGAGIVAATVAGCLGSGSSGGSGDGGESTANENRTTTNGSNGTESAANESSGGSASRSYEVCIQPAGCHTFEQVPETFVVIPGSQEDMAMALGLQPAAHAYPDRKPYKFYEQLPGVEHNPDEILQYGEGESARSYDREVFYEVNPDVILADPRMFQSYSGWSDADMREIEENVAPFLGSYIRFAFDGREPYYTMYELFERVAQLFQRQEQYAAWTTLHEEFMNTIESNLPSGRKPNVAVFWRGLDAESGEFRPAPINEKRNDARSFRDLQFRDAFEGTGVNGPVGYETLLDLDPDYLAAYNLSSMTGEEWRTQVVEPLESHSTASTLSAVQDGNVVRSAGQFMGPITHLFSTEALAKQVYPDQFGQWPGDSADIPENERLFDRQRVANIVTNSF